MRALQRTNQRLADRLLAEGRLTPEAHATTLGFIGIHGGRVEDALLDLGFTTEPELLRYIATACSTRFVSTEKLYKAAIDPSILQLVPRKLAEQHGVMPVIYDGARRVLSVVTADPDDLAMVNEVKIASGVREVVALVGRPSAVRAAISRAYHNDHSAFIHVMRGDQGLTLSVDRGPVSGAVTAPTPNWADAGRHIVQGTPQAQLTPPRRAEVPPPASLVLTPPSGRSALQAPTPRPPSTPLKKPLPREEAEPVARSASPSPPPRDSRSSLPDGAAVSIERLYSMSGQTTLTGDYLETLNVFVSLLETGRTDLRGHSGQCARLMRRVCERMGLTSQQTSAYVAATHLHDVGKAGTYHLTSLNVAEYEGHRTAAQKVYNVPERFFQGVNLHPDVKHAVSTMYERFDGRGFPTGVSGKDIPLGARILAVVDSYFDITTNPRNPARRVLKPKDAMEFLWRYGGTIFDRTVLELVQAEVAGNDLRAKLTSDRQVVLLVDPDPEDATVLELRLLESGFDVRLARTYQQALHELKTRDVSVVVSEVDLDVEDAGITLRADAATESWGKKVIAWVIHTRKTDRQVAEMVFELGVDDLVSKPTPPEVFAAKLKQLIERKLATRQTGRGVSGSLEEMGLPEVVQILWHGRKTCTVHLTSKKGSGEISFIEGQIVDANWGPLRGEDAFYQLLAIGDGDFKIDTDSVATERTIDISPEGLLLEGMRRMDEGLVS